MNCDYCDGTELVYELEAGRGPVRRCIPCLCIERAQPGVGWEEFQHYDEELQQHILETVNDYLTILARYRTDEALIERDPDAIGTVGEDTRTFFQNFMGADAHKRPSELTGGRTMNPDEPTPDYLGELRVGEDVAAENIRAIETAFCAVGLSSHRMRSSRTIKVWNEEGCR